MRIAVIQMTPVHGEVSENLERIETILSRDSLDADIVLFPELATAGYLYTSAEQLKPHAEVRGEGELATLLRKHAVSRGRAVIAGYPEYDPTSGRLYNSSIAVLPDGTDRNYRKSHLFYRESEVFSPGDTGFFTFLVAGISVGMMICYDWRFPEAARALALRGAEVILHPSNLVSPRTFWRPVMRSRAIENGVVVATANRSGSEVFAEESLHFTGGSLIIDQTGEVVAEAGEEDEILSHDIEIRSVREVNRHNDIWRDRRPDLYRDLCRVEEE